MREPDGHILVVEDDRPLRIECPYAPVSHPSCATWDACGCEVPRQAVEPGGFEDEGEPTEAAYDGEPCPNNPGLNHRYDPEYVGEMTAPTGDCWPAEMVGDIEPVDLGWPSPGRYVIAWENDDNGLVLGLGRPIASTSGAS
jgi:hypothetical protein